MAEVAGAARKAITMGAPLALTPLEALLWVVRLAAGEVQFFTAKITELEQEQVIGRPTSIRQKHYMVAGGLEKVEERERSPIDLNVWVKSRHLAMDRLAQYSALALKAGVEERQVRLAERMGDMIAGLLKGVLDDLQLTKSQSKAAPEIVRRRLAAAEAPLELAA